MSNLSRRSLVASAASLPALAVPAVAVADPSETELEALSMRVMEAWNGLRGPCDLQGVAEERWFEWRRLNPNATETEDEEFRMECGYFDARKAQEVANERVDEAIEALCEVRAQSLRGLIAKARAAEFVGYDSGDDLASSIVDDLLALGTVQS